MTSNVCHWPEQVAIGKCEHYCPNCGKHFLVWNCELHTQVPAAEFCDDDCYEDWQREQKSLVLREAGQDIAEYAVMLAVILVLVVGMVRLIGSNANLVFSQVASAIH